MIRLLAKPIVLALLAVLAGWGGFTEYRAWQNSQAVEEQITALKSQAQVVAQRNIQLEQQLQEVKTLAWQEKSARSQLGLKRDGEVVYDVPSPSEAGSNLVSPRVLGQGSQLENWKLWWYYLFVKPNEEKI